MTIQQYEDYGKQLIQYVPEPGPVQFCYLEEVGDPKEISRMARNELTSAPLLIWEAFDETLGNAGKDSYTSLITGSLAVLLKTDNSVAGIRQARERARTALLALLAQMRLDERESQLPDPYAKIENDRLPLERIGPVNTTWYGMGVAFTWRLPLDSRF